MANKPNPVNFAPEVPDFPSVPNFLPCYGKFDLTTYIQGASDYEIMCNLVQLYNTMAEGYNKVEKLSTDTQRAYVQLQNFVNTWFDGLDVTDEVSTILHRMVDDGSLEQVVAQTGQVAPATKEFLSSSEGIEQITPPINDSVRKWLDEHPEATTTVQDKSLTKEKFTNKLALETVKDYVTPEMFGALGDGVNDDTQFIQYCVDHYKNIVLTQVYKISSPITISNKTGIKISGKGATIKCVDCTGFVVKNSETIKFEGITLSSETATYPAFDLYEMRWRSYIRNCYITGFSAGIKTNVFDGCLVMSVENLYIIKCSVGIDDSSGGLQAVQFIGGRIENNTSGILISSPNVYFNSVVIEGNTNFGVKMINRVENTAAKPSSAKFINCYFESSLTPSILLGDDGWFGEISFTSCGCYGKSTTPFIKANGDSISKASSKVIELTNCTGFSSNTVGAIDGESFGFDTRITFNSYCLKPVNEWQLGKAKITYNSSGTIITNFSFNTKLIAGVNGNNSPIDIISSKKVTVYSPDESYSCSISVCLNNPWDSGSGAGAAPGALCFSKTHRKFYIRISYASDQSAWNEIVMQAIQQ